MVVVCRVAALQVSRLWGPGLISGVQRLRLVEVRGEVPPEDLEVCEARTRGWNGKWRHGAHMQPLEGVNGAWAPAPSAPIH